MSSETARCRWHRLDGFGCCSEKCIRNEYFILYLPGQALAGTGQTQTPQKIRPAGEIYKLKTLHPASFLSLAGRFAETGLQFYSFLLCSTFGKSSSPHVETAFWGRFYMGNFPPPTRIVQKIHAPITSDNKMKSVRDAELMDPKQAVMMKVITAK